MKQKGYAGQIKNSGTQRVVAPLASPSKPGKTIVRSGKK